MNIPLRQALIASNDLLTSPENFVGKTIADLQSAIDYLEHLRTDPMTADLVLKDSEVIEACANRLADVWTEIYRASSQH